jgi:hypothetical protein
MTFFDIFGVSSAEQFPRPMMRGLSQLGVFVVVVEGVEGVGHHKILLHTTAYM